MTTFHGNDGRCFNAPHDQSPMANKVLSSRVGIPRIHTRVGNYFVIIGNGNAYAANSLDLYQPCVESPHDRIQRFTMLLCIEHKLSRSNQLYKRVMRAVDAEKDLYSKHRWYAVSGDMRIPINVSPRADEIKARDAYLKSVRRNRMPPRTQIIFS